MTDTQSTGWFAGVEADDLEAAAQAIGASTATEPRDWPAEAIEQGFVGDEAKYYDILQKAAVRAAREQITERSLADDEQIKQRIRLLDDVDRIANELAERVREWATVSDIAVADGVDGVIALADQDPTTATEERLVAMASIVREMQTERSAIQADIEQLMHELAPNLTALAGPLLGARLLSLAGSLESLAKSPSGTVQVLGAEDALFSHLGTGSPPPKHGIIFIHEYVRGTDPAQRGSAARAVAGKLAIAARIDYYAGDLRPELARELNDRIERIRGRTS